MRLPPSSDLVSDPDLGTEHIAQTTRIIREAVVRHIFDQLEQLREKSA